MSIIPNNFVNAVVAIGVEQQCNGYIEKFWIGTGFLVSMQEPNNIQTSTIYLITNKHVLNGKNTVYIRFNSISGSFVKDYEIQLSAYIPYRDVLISQQTQETKMVQTENSGLTIVYPVDRIKEVVLLDWNRHREGVINTFGTYIAENTEKGQISNSN